MVNIRSTINMIVLAKTLDGSQQQQFADLFEILDRHPNESLLTSFTILDGSLATAIGKKLQKDDLYLQEEGAQDYLAVRPKMKTLLEITTGSSTKADDFLSRLESFWTTNFESEFSRSPNPDIVKPKHDGRVQDQSKGTELPPQD